MRTLLIILLFSGAMTGFAQSSDSAYLKISYTLNYLTDSSKPYRSQNDLQILWIGANSSFTCSELLFKRDSLINSRKQVGTDNKNMLANSENTRIGILTKFRIFNSFPDNKITVVDEAGLDKLYYEEIREKINWLIEQDTLSIVGYLCQKATCSYRGRNYVAWFTKEIPISAGPYKFQGLPGLILNIADTKHNYTFDCVGIEKIDPKQPITIAIKGVMKTSRKEFYKLQRNSFDDPWQSLKDRGITIGGRDGETVSGALKTPKPYNPIELN